MRRGRWTAAHPLPVPRPVSRSRIPAPQSAGRHRADGMPLQPGESADGTSERAYWWARIVLSTAGPWSYFTANRVVPPSVVVIVRCAADMKCALYVTSATVP